MGKDATQIRNEIEATRAQMGDTVEALGYKADVPARVRDDVSNRIESVKETISDAVTGSKKKARGTAKRVAKRAVASIDDSRDTIGNSVTATKRAAGIARENPLGLAIGALAFGFLGGLLIPISDIERERIGPLREKIGDRAQGAVAEAVDAGTTIATETLASVVDSAQQHGREIAQHAVAGTPLAT
jgi:hypothetical protein